MPLLTIDGCINLLELHTAKAEEYPFLLESVAKNEKTGRFNILFSKPTKVIKLKNINDFNFFTELDANWENNKSYEDKSIPTDIPFRGGWFVFFSYELAEQVEPTLSLEKTAYLLAYAGRCSSAIITDNILEKTFIVSDLDEIADINEIKKDIDSIIISHP